MNEEKKLTHIDPTVLKVSVKLFTREAYARYVGVTSKCIHQRIKKRELKTIPINGGDLIYVP